MNRKQRRIAAKQNRATEKKLSLADAIILGINLHQSGQIEEAEKIYRQVLQVKPGHPDALHYLGVISHQKGEKDEAVELIQKAISCNPAYSDAHNNLGNVLKEIGRLDEAEEAYRYCLSVDPEYVDALCNLGAVLKEKGKYVEALKMLERAITLAPNHSQAYHNLGNALKKLNRYAEAIIAYRKSITLLHPNDSKSYITSVYKSLSRVLYIDRNYKEVADVLKQWLEFDPENAAALHMLSACTGENIPARASDAFVEETFDNFAGSFDEILKKLDYQAPELVLSAVQTQIEDTDRQLVILDAGCGTGLCGPLLRDYASQLDGVDLSQGMVDKARDRDIYDDLVVAELTDYIANNSNTYDLIASADTLCYFGDLSSVLRAIFSALTEQGLLVFTVEKIIETEPAEAFRLNPHGRYSHTEEYVISTLNQSGLQLLSITTEHLRKEAGKSVTGMLVTAKKL
jgi:predicted TPR repeat methyltransferase